MLFLCFLCVDCPFRFSLCFISYPRKVPAVRRGFLFSPAGVLAAIHTGSRRRPPGKGSGAAGTHSTARAPGNGPATANSSGPIDASTIPGAAIRYRQALFPLWGSAAAPAAAGPTVFDTIRQETAAGDTLRAIVTFSAGSAAVYCDKWCR